MPGPARHPGVPPAAWAGFLRSPADALLACDFLETVIVTGARRYVLAVIEHHARRIRVLGATAHPAASRVRQAVRNLVTGLADTGCRARFLIRDRDGKFPGLFDAVLGDAGIQVVLTRVRMPRMNAICERVTGTLRRGLLNRILLLGERHLAFVLREYLIHDNRHRPHQSRRQRLPDIETQPVRDVAGLRSARRRPVVAE